MINSSFSSRLRSLPPPLLLLLFLVTVETQMILLCTIEIKLTMLVVVIAWYDGRVYLSFVGFFLMAFLLFFLFLLI